MLVSRSDEVGFAGHGWWLVVGFDETMVVVAWMVLLVGWLVC
jgi:hypothetical protein